MNKRVESKYVMRLDQMTSSRLSEGLIGLPPNMIRKIRNVLRRDVMWWLRDRMDGTPKEILRQAYDAYLEKWNISIPREPFAPTHNTTAYTIPVDLDGLGSNYTNLKPTVDKITFLMIWDEEKKLHGYWRDDKKVFVLYPLSLHYLSRFPSAQSHPDDIALAIDTMMATAEHELRHMVQSVILPNEAQRKMKPKYGEHGDDYFSSPVEFDPMIGSAVQEFLQLYATYKDAGAKINLKKSIKNFVGLTRDRFGSFQPDRFFVALRKSAPKRYRLAIKKFLIELEKGLASQDAKMPALSTDG